MTRLLGLAGRLWFVMTLAFILFHTIPRDPARLALGPAASEESVRELRAQWGLNLPLVQQYIRFVGNAATLSFGPSYRFGIDSKQLVLEYIKLTLVLSVFSLAISTGAAWICAFWWHMTRFGRNMIPAIDSGASFAASIPPLLWAVVVAVVFGALLKVVPLTGLGIDGDSSWITLFFPALAIACTPGCALIRLFVSEYRRISHSTWFHLLNYLGITKYRSFMYFISRELAYSWLAYAGNHLLLTFGGAIFVETVFSLPGVGSLIVSSALSFDLPVLETITLLGFIFFVSVSWLTSIASSRLDPRLHSQRIKV